MIAIAAGRQVPQSCSYSILPDTTLEHESSSVGSWSFRTTEMTSFGVWLVTFRSWILSIKVSGF